jgi:hypothetical protein
LFAIVGSRINKFGSFVRQFCHSAMESAASNSVGQQGNFREGEKKVAE